MRSLTLLTLLILALLAISARAGKVHIKGECIDCNRPDARTTTTHRPAATTKSGRGHGRQTTPKPKSKKAKQDSDEDDWNLSLHQDAHGGQHITSGGRHKRQWGNRQVIITDPGNGGGSWSGGRVTTLDSRGRPGTLLHNDDCVGCNING